jgi:hypothetical protein
MLRHWKKILILLLFLAAGFAIGWYLVKGDVPVTPVTDSKAKGKGVVRPKSLEGYCCAAPKSSCTLVPAPVECFRKKGRVFNTDQSRCDQYCLALDQ